MTLIKLDSGDYINTEFVEALLKMDDGWNAGMNHGETIRLTLADRDRIVEAMNGKPSASITVDADKVAGLIGGEVKTTERLEGRYRHD